MTFRASSVGRWEAGAPVTVPHPAPRGMVPAVDGTGHKLRRATDSDRTDGERLAGLVPETAPPRRANDGVTSKAYQGGPA